MQQGHLHKPGSWLLFLTVCYQGKMRLIPASCGQQPSSPTVNSLRPDLTTLHSAPQVQGLSPSSRDHTNPRGPYLEPPHLPSGHVSCVPQRDPTGHEVISLRESFPVSLGQGDIPTLSESLGCDVGLMGTKPMGSSDMG